MSKQVERTSLNRVKHVVKRLRRLQTDLETRKTGRFKKITDTVNNITKEEHARLNIIIDRKTGELLSKPVCSFRYYSQLMNDCRNAVKALDIKHHNIKKTTKAFIAKYGNDTNELGKKLNHALPLKKLRDNLIILKAEAVTGSKYKKDLNALHIEHALYYRLEPKGSIKDWIKDSNKESLETKLSNRVLVNPEWAKDKAKEILTKKKISEGELCVGIALATGRRITEIMKTARLSAIDDKTLLFSGQLKTKNRHLFEEIAPYKIPSMVDSDIVVKALKTLRKKTKNKEISYIDVLGETVKSTVGGEKIKDYYHNKAVQKKYESSVNTAVRIVFKNGSFSLKDCRDIYTAVTYKDHSKEGESRSAYRSRVLGHSFLEAQVHYDSFEVDENIKAVQLTNRRNKDKQNSQDNQDNDSALLDYLKQFDKQAEGYLRAPNILVLHNWLKTEVTHGLQAEQITQSYIRRNCLTQINPNTIKKYINEVISISNFTA